MPYFRVRDIRLLDTRESAAATIHTLRLRFSDISVTRTLPDTAVLKVSHAGHPLADKEVTFYGRILPELKQAHSSVELPICDCYDSYYDIDTDQSHVLLAWFARRLQGTDRSESAEPAPLFAARRFLGQNPRLLLGRRQAGRYAGNRANEAELDERLARQREGYQRFLTDRMIRLDPAQKSVLDMVVGKMPV